MGVGWLLVLDGLSAGFSDLILCVIVRVCVFVSCDTVRR